MGWYDRKEKPLYYSATATDMTEDDTFRKLRRRPFEEMDAEYRSRFWEFYNSRRELLLWLDESGWTEAELAKEGNARSNFRG